MATADYIDPSETEAHRETGAGSRPLSPTLVASLRLDLAWLDSRRSPASGTSTASEPDHSTSGSLYHQKRRQSIPPTDGTSSPTLASRRIHAAARAGGERPPLFRRRSKSLDDVTAPELDRSSPSFGPVPHPAGLRLVCVPKNPVSGASTSATSAAAAPTAPPLSAISLDGSLASLISSSTNTTVTPNAKPSRPRPSRMNGTGGEHGECDDRLAKWVASSSSASTASSTARSQTLTPQRASRSTRAASPGHVPMPPAALHHPNSYAPVLPSPLSTCSYTSADDDARNGESESPDTAPRGFPFPVTPSRISPSAQEPQNDTLSGSDADTRRPTLQARESAGTTSSLVTEVDTPQPATSPDRGHTVASPLPGAFTSTRTTNTLASTSYVNLPSASDAPASTSSSPVFPSGSSSFSFADANAYGRRPSVASTSSASAAARSHGAPLTPPESLSTAPFLFGASAAEMAWHEVLGARYGAGTSIGSGSAGSGGDGRNREGAYGYGAGGGHVRRKTDDSLMSAAVGGLVAAATVASQSPGSAASPSSGRNGNRDPSGPAGRQPGGGAGAAAPGAERPWSGNELMGCAAGGGYAATTREKLAGLLDRHVSGVPFDPVEDKTVQLVEYGALNSRSSALTRPVLEHFAERELVALRAELTAQHADDSPSAAAVAAAPGITRRTSDSSNPELDELVSFQVTHVDRPTADFRCLADSLEHDPQSYLRPRPRRPSEAATEGDFQLEGRVFSAFAARPFGVKAVPRKSVSVGWSVMSLHWPATDRRYRVAPATLAHGELMSFLSARASEFKPGGVLALAYLARTEEAALAASATTSSPSMQSVAASTPSPSGTSGSSPSSKGSSVMRGPKADVWTYMTRLLGKAIQRLVSTGLLKPQVARQLLALPLHPRTPRQTGACLRASAHSWDVLESEMVTLSHPAWKGVEHGTVSIESWADHTIQMLKIFWEDEMRTILRDVLGSRGACEWVLDCLWTVAKEKIEEQPPQPLDLEVQFVALRRRSSSTSSRDVTPSASTDIAAA